MFVIRFSLVLAVSVRHLVTVTVTVVIIYLKEVCQLSSA